MRLELNSEEPLLGGSSYQDLLFGDSSEKNSTQENCSDSQKADWPQENHNKTYSETVSDLHK
jgi:hypothetical protein